MNAFVITMAWRETRAAWRHFFYFLTCIAVGVGALVGVSLFSAQLGHAVTKEARGLLGGDLEIRLSRQISQDGLAFLASLSHRNIATTMRYIHMDTKETKASTEIMDSLVDASNAASKQPENR